MALVIDYKNVHVSQDDTPILKGIDLQVEEGDFVYMTGKVGSGKSTLLKTMYGELPIQAGQALMLGTYHMENKLKDSKRQELRRQLGIVFQDFQLLGDRTVEHNLDFVLRATGWKNKEEISNRIDEVLKQVGLEDKRKKYPNELSGGEQQRICIARAILNKPKLILADEPTGNLDSETCKDIMQLLQGICENGTAIVMTTHNRSLFNYYPGTIYHIEGEHMVDKTEEYNKPFDMDEFSELDKTSENN